MIIFLDSDAKIRAQHDGNVGRGSSASWIYIVAPISASNAFISFALPNGDYTEEAIATQEISAVDLGLILPGTRLHCWSYKLEQIITQYSGNVSYTVSFTFSDGSDLVSNQGSFNVARGVPSLLPDQSKAGTYEQIKAYLEAVAGANTELLERIKALEEKYVDFDVLCTNVEEALSESGFQGEKGDKGDKGEKGDKGGGCGITTPENGEIFNDYTNNKANKNFSTVRGKNNVCDGVNAVVGGANSYASANNSFTHGENLRNTHLNNTIIVGRHNDEKANSVFEVGYGYDADNKYNAFEVIRTQAADGTDKKKAIFSARIYQNKKYFPLPAIDTNSVITKTYLAGYTGGKFHISQSGVAEILNATTKPILNMGGGYAVNGTKVIDENRNLTINSINGRSVSGFAKIAHGTYEGNGLSGVTLALGFRPLMVVIQTAIEGIHPYVNGTDEDGFPVWKNGIIWTGQEALRVTDKYIENVVFYLEFSVSDESLAFSTTSPHALNANGVTYEYFAIGY